VKKSTANQPLHCVCRPLAEERLAISTKSIHLEGYSFVADNTEISSFV